MTLPSVIEGRSIQAQPQVLSTRHVVIEERGGKVYVRAADDSLVKIDELVAQISTLKDTRDSLQTILNAARNDWDDATAAGRQTMTKNGFVVLAKAVIGLLQVVAWLVQRELKRG
ncbi:hypothetical protein G4Y79_20930 [Phototrophicus methaneseepsis]|uniref:Uncharacterized protein n=1 Tax=Phototrophicus methaneseepsis TaxID=2710758 RepID=A0A7S8IE25_9CHLR|nr:hypothetical protein [Phototrophicus methaneseepsis]QPC82122.1 hypothetical protein G4Y79_20930 [Phototrophicus methaneseepsis]